MACLAEIGVAIVTKVAELTVEPVIRQVGYMINYNDNIEDLQTKISDLVAARASLQHSIEEEERNGKTIEQEVQDWLTGVDQLTKEADELKAQTKFLKGFCANPKLRHRLSRKSTKLVLGVAVLHEKRKNIDKIAYAAPLEEVCAMGIQDYEAIDSRTSMAKKIIDQLRKSDTYDEIGVYGIGGVGKTTLIKEVYRQLNSESEKLFDEVVMVLDLKQDPSIERIQKEIAEKLSLKLPEGGTQAGRASLISNRIKNKKTLVILDDVWDFINLKDVGLPHMATLKIVLTSRTKIVLEKEMITQNYFSLKLLSTEESWTLFQEMAGDIAKRSDIQPIAIQVAEKCGRLPLLIATVARSLKDKDIQYWNDVSRRLKNFDKDLTELTYLCLEWSYNNLKTDELKSVFLLSATQGGNVLGMLDLLKYSIGMGIIENVETVEEARNALHVILGKLQDSCLLDTYDNGRVRIHDLVLKAAKRISKDQVISVSHGSELKEWPNHEFRKKCTKITLKKCIIPELPQVLECPELTMLHLTRVDADQSPEVPSNFFKEMKKLKVMDLTKWSISSLPPSLKCLEELQTLCLDQCKLGDISFVGGLRNLKILSLLYSKFKELPEELGNLTSLRLLDLTGCSELVVISPDVISKLIRLEELRMGKNSFNKWEAGRVGEANRSNASLEELMCLPHLTTLHMHALDASILPANLFTTNKLERFQICIGSVWKWEDVDKDLNTLKLELCTTNELDYGLRMLLKRTQDLYVGGMQSNINDKLFHELATGAYHQLKHLHVQNQSNFAYTVNEKVGFLNLTWLAVSQLNGIRFLLSSSMARSLSQLKCLQVSECQMMEEVISMEEFDREIVTNFFPQLQDLELNNLPNLTKFCSISCAKLPNPSGEILQLKDSTESGGICEEVAEIVSIRNLDSSIEHLLFGNKVEFRNMKKLSIKGLAKLTSIWNDRTSLDNSNIVETIDIDSCNSLESIFPPSVARKLQQLRSLKVQNCGAVSEIISLEESGLVTPPTFVFPKVTYVRFQKLPQLKSFYQGSHVCKLPSLEYLVVYDCKEVHILADGLHDSDNLNTPDKRSMFLLQEDTFPNLERLGFQIMENWVGSYFPQLHLFRKLKELRIHAQTNSSLSSLKQFLGLEKVNGEGIRAVGGDTFPFLIFLNLDGMRKLMNLGDDSLGILFPKVETLWIQNCDSLKSLRSSAISFNYLTTLQVIGCKGLKYLISFSVAQSMVHLITLKVRDCAEMIQVVASRENEDGRDEIEFRALKTLELSGLPSLRGYCSRNYVVRFPSLESLSMASCTQFEGFIFDSTEENTEETNSNGNSQNAKQVQRFLFGKEVEVRKLTRLILKGLAKVTGLWNTQRHDETSRASFSCENLEYVNIDSCENLQNIFPLWMARNLRQLQTLIVKNSGVKEIVAAKEDGFQTTMFKLEFPKVTQVLFKNLPQLINFYPGMHVCRWPMLNNLRVIKCDKVDIFAKEISSFQQNLESTSYTWPLIDDRHSLFHVDKDSFPNLEQLVLNAREFSSGPFIIAAQLFGKLKLLDVDCPDSKSLVFLDESSLLDPRGGNNVVGRTMQHFPYLKELRLFRMEKRMDLGPDVEDDNLQSVPRLPNIPNLQILFVNESHSLRNLRTSAISFNNLTTLQVIYCNRLEYLITYPMATSLIHLTTLEVKECPRLQQIVGSKDDNDSRNEITFPKLKSLKLSALPRLQSFCSGNCITKFPSLETSTMSNRLKFKIFTENDQPLPLIMIEEEDTDTSDDESSSEADTDVDASDQEPTVEHDTNSPNTDLSRLRPPSVSSDLTGVNIS